MRRFLGNFGVRTLTLVFVPFERRCLDSYKFPSATVYPSSDLPNDLEQIVWICILICKDQTIVSVVFHT